MTNDENRLASLDTFFKQWKEISQQIKTLINPTYNLQQRIFKSLEPLLEAQKSLHETIRLLNEDSRQLNTYFQSQANDIRKAFEHSFKPIYGQFQKYLQELPRRTQEAVLVLGEHGWYLDLEMGLSGFFELQNALLEGNEEEVENALMDHFEARLQEIEESLLKRFPHRAHIIRSAFLAHTRQEYELSVPVFLAQADGICKEVFNEHLFMKQDKKPRTAIYVEQMALDTFTAALLSPLGRTLPISASEYERSKDSKALNRHTVLHGESLDYGSKINSLKAISLLNYVSNVLKDN